MGAEQSSFLGIEGGGTKTTAILAGHSLQLLARREFGPGNVRLLDDEALSRLLAEISSLSRGGAPRAVGIGLAGVRTPADRTRVLAAAAHIWPGTPVVVTHDLEIALAAAVAGEESVRARILVLSGTGSCCYGRNPAGHEAKLGGWGHLLGDRASGYALGLAALRAVTHAWDRHGHWTKLGQELLRTLQLNSPEDLIGWSQQAEKAEIATLASALFQAARAKDRLARPILDEAAESLARDALLCAGRLAGESEPATFVLAGGVLKNQSAFARAVAARIRRGRARSKIVILSREGAWGAVHLARLALTTGPVPTTEKKLAAPKKKPSPPPADYVPAFNPLESPTEQRNPRSAGFDRMPVAQMIALMLAEEARCVPALLEQKRGLQRAVRLAIATLKKNGRLFYAGAGTSGRLGILDASECPPTFRTPPEQIQGLIAGGPRAIAQAVEGAEDDFAAGGLSLRGRGVGPGDLVVGITASGRTPFVWGALAEARRAGAKTILLCFNPNLLIERSQRPSVVLAPNLGPEVLTGSTRLKCGTATKLVLNLLSTIALTKLGKVISNLMVDLNPSNTKLRARAIRIVRALCECDDQSARAALEKNGWVVKKAWADLRRHPRLNQ